ncbi:MAG: HPF/RaiA family ribosome-associated protein [Candidatus Babeliaceae bacterium]|jgi:ribosomal subunit interface protein
MNKRIVFRGMEHSGALEKYVDDNFKKIETFLEEHPRTPITYDIVFESHPTHATKKCEVRITSPEFHVIVSKEGQDMYKVAHDALDSAYAQLLKEKAKVSDKNIHGHQKPVESVNPEEEDNDKE